MSPYIILVFAIIIFCYLLHYYLYNYVEINDISSIYKLSELKDRLQEKMYGQHLVFDNIPDFLKMHYQLPMKALVLSLHGSRGTGKSHFVNIFKETMFKDKPDSVYTFTESDVPLSVENPIVYQKRLHEKIRKAISTNPRSLFIFEGVEKMSTNIIKSLESYLGYTYFGRDPNLNTPIFLFISNTGSQLILKKLHNDFRQAGNNRTSARLEDFEQHLPKWISKEQSTLFSKSNIIDHYIPFLPLEKEHVLLCVKNIFLSKGIKNPNEEQLKEVLSHLEWTPQKEKIYAVSGCKDIKHKVILVMNKYKLLEEKLRNEHI